MQQGGWPDTDELSGEVTWAVMGVDESLELLWASPAAVRLFGTRYGQLPDLVEAHSAPAVAAFLDHLAEAGGSAVRISCAISVEGSSDRRVDLVGRDMRDVDGVGCVVVVAHDVTGWAEPATLPSAYPLGNYQRGVDPGPRQEHSELLAAPTVRSVAFPYSSCIRLAGYQTRNRVSCGSWRAALPSYWEKATVPERRSCCPGA